MWNIMKNNDPNQNKSLRQFKFWNKWMIIPLYRASILPLFGLGRVFILLYTKGKKSGLQRIAPLEYRRYEGDLVIFSSRGKFAHWFRNLEAAPDDVMIKKGFRKYKPEITIVSSVEERGEILMWYCKSFPRIAKSFFGYEKSDIIAQELVKPMAEFIEIVRLKI